jgi:hypothetical protein
MDVNKWYTLVKENLILFTQNLGITIVVLITTNRFYLKNEPGCICGFEYENSYHLFMECPLYDDIRRNWFVILRIYREIDLNIILYGNTELSRSKQWYFLHGSSLS